MLGLGAKRKVKDPYGNVWELYTTRTSIPRDPNAPGLYRRNTKILGDPLGDSFEVGDPLVLGLGLLVSIPLAIVQLIGSALIGPLLRFPFRYGRGRRSGAVRIEAISFFPRRETRYWTTTPDQLDSVLDEIAAGLEAGKVAQPAGTVYMGSREE